MAKICRGAGHNIFVYAHRPGIRLLPSRGSCLCPVISAAGKGDGAVGRSDYGRLKMYFAVSLESHDVSYDVRPAGIIVIQAAITQTNLLQRFSVRLEKLPYL